MCLRGHKHSVWSQQYTCVLRHTANFSRAAQGVQGRSFNALGSGIADNIVGRPVAVVRGATSSSLRRVVQDVGQLTSVSPCPSRARCKCRRGEAPKVSARAPKKQVQLRVKRHADMPRVV